MNELLRVIFKEMRWASCSVFVYGVFLGILCTLIYQEPPLLGLVVGLSIFVIMAMAATIGTFVPLVLKRFGFDAAIATGPFVTTSIDILGVMLYFYTARFILGL